MSSEKLLQQTDFSCSICNKNYKSYQSIWNHNKLYHTELNIKISNKERNFSCAKCNKKFTRKDTLVYHNENTCKNKNNNTNEIIELKKQVAELQKIVTQNQKTTNNNTTNNNTTNNINHGTINNIIYINKTGTENYLELNDNETTEIFNKEISGVVSLIKFINFNERLPSNHSFCTKSLEGKYMLTYNIEESKVESTRKKYFYQELLSSAVIKMELLYIKHKSKFPKDKQVKIEDTIKKLKEIKDRDFSDKILREIKYELIRLSYNCRNTVLNTWENNKTEGKIITNDEEIKEFTEKDMAEFDDLFIERDSDTSDSDSDTLSIPKLLPTKKKNIIV
jgi:hypothetical protein